MEKASELVTKDSLLLRNAVRQKTACSQHTQGIVISVDFTWSIGNFTFKSQTMKNGESLDSKIFSAEGDEKFKWQLVCYPKGSKGDHEDFIACFLRLKSDDAKVTVKYVMSVLDTTNGTFCHRHKHFHTFNKSGFGCLNFLSQKDLLDKNCKYLKEDVLTLQCQLSYESEVIDSSHPSRSKIPRLDNTSEGQITQHLGHFLDSGRMSDITFIVGRQKFKAHKIIMSARSPVFARKFEINGKVSSIETLKIENCEPEVFQAMLRFFYTDEMEETEETAKKLLAVAKTYQVQLLHLKCEDVLRESLSTDNCAEILMLADIQDVPLLKKYALDYFRHNSGEVVKSAGWQALRENRPCLAINTLECLV